MLAPQHSACLGLVTCEALANRRPLACLEELYDVFRQLGLCLCRGDVEA